MKMMEGLDLNTPWSKIEDSVDKSHYHLKACDGINEGVCPRYAMGKCDFAKCTARHLYGRETPKKWTANFCKTIEPGLNRIKNGEEIQPRKRGRTGQRSRN